MNVLNKIRIFLFYIMVIYYILTSYITYYILETIFTRDIANMFEYFIYKHIFLNILNCNIDTKDFRKMLDNKKYIIMCNHYTGLDYFILRSIFTDSYTIVKSDLISQRKDHSLLVKMCHLLINVLLKSGKLISYIKKNSKSGAEVLEKTKKLLKHSNIIIFPEGQSYIDGKLVSFKKGMFDLAYTENISIIPCSLKYSKDIGMERFKDGSITKLVLSDWIGIDAKLIISDIVEPKNFNSSEELLTYTFNIINKNYRINTDHN